MGTRFDPATYATDAAQELEELRGEVQRLRASQQDGAVGVEASARFLAHVSHELRTPMNSILGMTRLVLGTELTAEQREHLTVIDESTEDLLTLVNDLLDQAKISSGRLELEEIEFRLADAVHQALRAMKVMTDHKGVSLELEVDPDVSEDVIGDPTRLRQVILNLLSNATKFTDAGQITLSIDQVPGTDSIAFAVTDTGIGIPESKLSTIFEEFRQADISTTRRYGGSGLGLSISAELVRHMGGALTVESKVGEGSTFRFTAHLPAAAPAEAAERRTSRGGAPLLWLTDQGGARTTMVAAVEDRGLTATVVSSIDGALAAKQAATTPYAALIVDLQTDALDAAWELGRETAGTPTIVVTPGGQRGDAARCRELGVAAYLTGPLVALDLTDTLDAVIGGAAGLVTRHWLNERRRSLHIIVADDSETNRALLVSMLEGRGHRAITAANGHEVLKALADNRVDAILLDLHMPEVDGFEVATRIRSGEVGTPEVPIVAVSGSVTESGRSQSRNAGIEHFIAKPFKPEVVLELVEQLAGG